MFKEYLTFMKTAINTIVLVVMILGFIFWPVVTIISLQLQLSFIEGTVFVVYELFAILTSSFILNKVLPKLFYSIENV